MSAEQPQTTPELWCVHIPGPDDLYAAVSREEAQKHADALNAAISRFYQKNPRTENHPSEVAMTAVVVPWPWDAVSHAQDVIRWAKEECKGNA